MATREKRLVAKVLDFLILVPAYLPLLAADVHQVRVYGYESGLAEEWIWLPLFIMLAISVVQWYLIATTGQSIGKRALGIKIVRGNGSLPGFLNGVFLRDWPLTVVSQCLPVLGLVDVLFIFGRKRRCLHDLIASTYVINADAELRDGVEPGIAEVFR